MDCEIEWRDRLDPDAVALCIDRRKYVNGRTYFRFIEQELAGEPTLTYACCRVRFNKSTPDDEADHVMQTILMMARVRYGL